MSLVLTGVILLCLLQTGAEQSAENSEVESEVTQFESNLENLLSTEYGGKATQVKRGYYLWDDDVVAPVPNESCYGEVSDPHEMEPIIQQAKEMLDIGDMIFSPDVTLVKGSTIRYYLDETIFAMVWKTPINGTVYTFSEVKVAHASQFRRFLSEGKYNSGVLHTTTEMAKSVNAVLASSGDYYAYRRIGIVVNNGQVYRSRGHFLDTCFIDKDGDMHFSYAGEMIDKETVEQYVEEHDIRFSISFGPVLILEGKNVVPYRYNSGEINQEYPRAALCQIDTRHYLTAVANIQRNYYNLITLKQFADALVDMGVQTAYTLDGGQTGTTVFQNDLINSVSYNSEREISDIIYFASAIPDDD